MKRIAFKMYLKVGYADEYLKRHTEIWPQLIALLKDHEIQNYSIFLDEDGQTLFAYQVIGNHSSQAFGEDEIMKKWWAYMADIMYTNEDLSPISTSLTEIFYLK